MSGGLTRWVGLRTGEFGKTAGMFLYLMMAVGAFITGRIARDALFLSRYDVSYLPYMYVWTAVVMALLSYAYSHFADRFRRDRLILGVTSILLVGVLAARAILALGTTWFYPVLYVYIEVMGGLMIIQFWTFANDVFNTREAKRLFGLVGAGGVVATILTGFAVGGLARQVGTANLLFLCAGLLGGCLALVFNLSRRFRQELEHALSGSVVSGAAISLGADLGRVFSSRHLKVIAWMVILTFAATTVIDYQFKMIARTAFLNREDHLSGFFGLFFACTGVLSFFIQFLLTGRLIQRFGILICLLFLPVSLLAGSSVFLLVPALWSATLLKGADTVLRYTVNDATIQILYLPVPGHSRGRAKAFIDGILKPCAQGITGLAIAWTTSLVAHRVHYLGVGTLAVLAAWVVMVAGLKHEYVRSLMSTLRQRRIRFGRSGLVITDARAVETLQQTLGERDEQHVLNALEMLPYARQRDWTPELGRLLDHDSARVRLQALRLMEPEGCLDHVQQLHDRFYDSDEDVRAEAVMSYCSTLQDKAMREVEPLLQDESVKVQASAVVGLIRYGGLDGMLTAAGSLQGMVGARRADHRRAGAWAIGKVGVKSFYRSLLPLLEDPEVSVRLEAIRAAGALRCPELTLPLIYLLADPQTSKASVSALGQYGPALITILRTVLDNRSEDPAIRQAIPRVLARIGGQLSMDVLANVLETEETGLRSSVLDAILYLHLRSSDLRRDIEMFRRSLHRELKEAYQLTVIIAELAELDGELIVECLRNRLGQIIQRMFKLLRVLHPDRHLDAVANNLGSPVPSIRANSIELLDNVLDTETRRCLIPLLEERDLRDRASLGDDLFPLLHMDATGWLHRLLMSDHEWTVVCALYAVGHRRTTVYESTVRMLLCHPSPMVRETAAFCLNSLLAPDELTRALESLRDDPHPRVRNVFRALAAIQATPHGC